MSDSETTDQFLYWREALKGNFIEEMIQRGNPQSGFYRDKNRGVCIYRAADGLLVCRATDGYVPVSPDEIDDLFGFVNRRPITRELYVEIRGGGKWPDHVEIPPERGVGDNSEGRGLHEIIGAQINELFDEAKKWLAARAGKIETAEDADKAANYAAAFGELEARSEKARKEEKGPLDKAVKEVQAKWTPVSGRADEKKRWMKGVWELWAKAERQRKREEEQRRLEIAAQAQREAAERAAERGDDLPEPVAAPITPAQRTTKSGAPAVSSGGGRVALREKKVAVVKDAKAMLTYFANMTPPPADLVEAARMIAQRLNAAGGVAVDGVEIKIEEHA